MTAPRLAVLTLATAALAAAPRLPRADEGGCRGTLSGDVKGQFTCVVRLSPADDATAVIEVLSRDPIAGVPAYAPGAFQIPEPVRPGTYSLETLGMGKASVAAEGGTLYTAAKTSGQRGEVTLVLASVEKVAGIGRAVHGSYRARLVPAGSGKQGEVVVEVSF